jgi:hypothetical protein
MALPLTLIALLLITGLAMASLALARLRMSGGFRRLAARQALEAARGAVDRHAAEWDSTIARAVLVAMKLPLPPAYASARVVTSDTLLRLGTGLYVVKSNAVVWAAGRLVARDGVIRVVRVTSPLIRHDSAAAARLADWVLRSSRDNVSMMSGVSFVTSGWSRSP